MMLRSPSLTVVLSRIVSLTRRQRITMATGGKVGVVQMTSTADKEANYTQAESLIQDACSQGAQMVYLPECFDYVGESQKLSLEAAETIDGPTIGKYRHLARKNNVWLSLGGFHEKVESGSKILNTHVIVDARGEIRARYSKIHLFNVNIPGKVRLQETDFTQPGSHIGPPVATPVGNVGLAICYDLRFPEMSVALTQQGADILTYPSAFTVPTGTAHWEVLLRCRAIENQCYVVAAAQVGKHNDKRSSYGHTMVVDPWGQVVVDLPDMPGPGVQVFDVDVESLRRRRAEMPVWEHRRHDLYGHIEVTTDVCPDVVPRYQFGQVTVISSHVIYRSALSIVFVNRKPVVPGHLLVTPVRCVERFSQLTQAEVADLFRVVQRVAGVIQRHHQANSLTIGVQDGEHAGQTIKHVHVHVLPRKPGDFQKNDDVYKHLEDHDKDVCVSEWRTDDDMTSESTQLRQLFS